MTKMNDGELAFPNTARGDRGMTLRDYFAAKAMQAMLSRPDASAENEAGLEVMLRFVCKQSYFVADEMIAAREQSA